MTRPLHRGRIAEGGSRAQLNGRQEEDDRPSHSSNSNYIFLPHSARLWIKQQIYSHLISPVSYKSSSKFSPKSSENVDNFSTSLALSPSPDPKDIISLDSNMGPTSSSISSNPARGRMLKWFVLCVITIFVLITLLGSTSSSSSWLSASTSPSETMYRNYKRLREQVMMDTSIFSLGLTRPKELALCTRDRGDFIPCYNVSANVLAGYMNGDEYDRHCDLSRSRQPCLVRAPKDYKIPLKWPTGKDVIWSGNVRITKDQLLSSGSMTKRLMLLEENQISFRSEDALVVDGVKDYSHQIAEMIGLHDDSEFIQAGVHTVLDIGCGFGSFGAHLFSRNLLTMCIAAYEIYGSQVQLALERGLPAMIGAFISSQLPYPSLSYDIVHCARCGIDWHQKGGTLLIEVDRVLKPGGYFVWTSPLTNPQGAMLSIENQNNWKFVEDFTQKICWDFLSQQDETAVWQKTKDKDCYGSRKLGDVPPVCKMGQDLESPYYQSLPSCIGGTLSRRWIPVQNQTRWPARITLSSSELAIHGIQAEDFIEDSRAWKLALKDYWSLLTPLIFSDHPKRPGEEDPLPPFNMLRNVMDMNARYGGFNDALLEAGKTVWVMNVIPTSTSNTLPVILDRGFVGVLHNWCEAFPTYPRTYDMLHAAGLLSQELYSKDKCSIADLLLEMDRILRPEGWVVLRDKVQVIEEARAITSQMRWDARVVELEGDNGERLLVCQKPFLKK